MTPERKAWWDSLPKEEKQVRQKMAAQQAKIYYLKSLMNNELIVNRNACMDGIRNSKYIIKALRKQIAMRPVIKKEFKMFRYCPTCDCILNVSKARPFCDKCGQKLRWK